MSCRSFCQLRSQEMGRGERRRGSEVRVIKADAPPTGQTPVGLLILMEYCQHKGRGQQLFSLQQNGVITDFIGLPSLA